MTRHFEKRYPTIKGKVCRLKCSRIHQSINQVSPQTYKNNSNLGKAAHESAFWHYQILSLTKILMIRLFMAALANQKINKRAHKLQCVLGTDPSGVNKPENPLDLHVPCFSLFHFKFLSMVRKLNDFVTLCSLSAFGDFYLFQLEH